MILTLNGLGEGARKRIVPGAVGVVQVSASMGVCRNDTPSAGGYVWVKSRPTRNRLECLVRTYSRSLYLGTVLDRV